MPEMPSARLGLPAPSPTDPADVPGDMVAMRDRLDETAAAFDQGASGLRPAAGASGRFYFATDTGEMFYDTGGQWRMIAAETEPARYVGTAGQPALLAPFSTAALRFWRTGRRVGFAGAVGQTYNPWPGSAGGTDVFVLPVGYRPATTKTGVRIGSWAGVYRSDLVVTVGVDGLVRLGGAYTVVHFDGFAFDLD